MERLTTHDELKQPWVIPANERTWRNIYKKLAAYEDAEEDGRLIILPCKVGTKVYRVKYVPNAITKNPIYVIGIRESKFHLWYLDEFGKTVFLTREEAEAALAAMKE